MLFNSKQYIVIFIFLLGCNSDNQYIRSYKVYKQSLEIEDKKSPSGLGVTWKSPDSWVEYNSDSSMRLASYQVPYYGYESSKIDYGDLSIFVFNQDSGTDQENVNRWRGQIGLPPQTKLEIDSSAQNESNNLGSYKIFKLINKSDSDTAFLCAIMPINDNKIFIKLSISKIGINIIEKDFFDFCQSFKVVE